MCPDPYKYLDYKKEYRANNKDKAKKNSKKHYLKNKKEKRIASQINQIKE